MNIKALLIGMMLEVIFAINLCIIDLMSLWDTKINGTIMVIIYSPFLFGLLFLYLGLFYDSEVKKE